MIYIAKCYVCKKRGNVGVYSKQPQPKGWYAMFWHSEHSEHIEVVCSIACLQSIDIPEEDVAHA